VNLEEDFEAYAEEALAKRTPKCWTCKLPQAHRDIIAKMHERGFTMPIIVGYLKDRLKYSEASEDKLKRHLKNHV
jgi:hypothetical protein